MATSPFLAAALAYAQRGWKVFPIKPKAKAPPLVQHGLKDASDDPKQITDWWVDWPDANIGIATGAASGIDVADLDTHGDRDGLTQIAILEDEHGQLPMTLEQVTPTGGRHLIFERDPDHPFRNSASKKVPGIDTRGDGGYIVAPPSVHPNGGIYRWDNDAEIVRAPPWLATALGLEKVAPEERVDIKVNGGAANYVEAAVRNATQRVSAAPQGTRNQTLNTEAYGLGRLIGGNYLDRPRAERALMGGAMACGLWGDDGADAVMKTIASGLQAGIAKPQEIEVHRPERSTSVARPNGAAALSVSQTQSEIPPLSIIRREEWAQGAAPSREWLVDQLIPLRNVTMLAGDGGIGKSLLGLQLLAAAANGEKWVGQQTLPCAGFGLFCEDERDELWRRSEDIARLYGKTVYDLVERLTLVSRVHEDNVLFEVPEPWRPPVVTPLYQQIEAEIRASGARLIVIDSLHDVFGANEIVRQHARAFIAALRRLAVINNGAVLLLSHPSVAGIAEGSGRSGSTAWNNAVRSRLYLTYPKTDDPDEEPDTDERILARKKANYARSKSDLKLRWKEGVLIPTEPAPGSLLARITFATAHEAFLHLLDAFNAENRPVSDNERASTFAPRLFKRRPECRDFTENQMRRAMEGLFSEAKIAVEDFRTADRKTVRRIVRRPAQQNLEGL